ncbi:TRAP transporter small permease subunit [Acuticoccus sp. M5D2P5]|uniref:TRAP transporter small permease n=1 Tax=Acuticoccus kalidii TaxID=2910977 RepID=UPI001F3529C1|nr:TRAP transporter small permease subunit [Acuticoccus kalidii]MCF3933225.1 TRAP transporter small permease subunit [Acuticoccus kalidii]
MLDFLARIEAGLAFAVKVAATLVMIVVAVFTLGSASDRYIYDTHFNAYDQIAQLALVWLTFLGIVLAFRAGTNIRVDLVDGMLPVRLLALRDILSDVAAIGIFGVIQWKVWRLVEVGAGQVIMGTPFSSDATFLALAVSSAAAMVVVGMRLVRRLARWGAPPADRDTAAEDRTC